MIVHHPGVVLKGLGVVQGFDLHARSPSPGSCHPSGAASYRRRRRVADRPRRVAKPDHPLALGAGSGRAAGFG